MKLEDYNKYRIKDTKLYVIPAKIFKELVQELDNWKVAYDEQLGYLDKKIRAKDHYIGVLKTIRLLIQDGDNASIISLLDREIDYDRA